MPNSNAGRKTKGCGVESALTLEDLAAYCGDECPPEVRRQIQAEAADPESDLGRFLAELRGYTGWACTPDLFTPAGGNGGSLTS